MPLYRFLGIISILFFSTFAENAGFPIRYIGGCEIELNGDSIPDKTILIETKNNIELIALVSEKGNGYKAFTLYKGMEKNLFINCEFVQEINASLAVSEKSKAFTLNAFVIRLSQPESSSSIFYWKNGKFEQIWTRD
jgi:hypothetical protein